MRVKIRSNKQLKNEIFLDNVYSILLGVAGVVVSVLGLITSFTVAPGFGIIGMLIGMIAISGAIINQVHKENIVIILEMRRLNKCRKD